MQKRKSNILTATAISQVASERFSAKKGRGNKALSTGPKRKLSLAEVADKLEGRNLFSEKKKNAKAFLNKLHSFPI